MLLRDSNKLNTISLAQSTYWVDLFGSLRIFRWCYTTLRPTFIIFKGRWIIIRMGVLELSSIIEQIPTIMTIFCVGSWCDNVSVIVLERSNFDYEDKFRVLINGFTLFKSIYLSKRIITVVLWMKIISWYYGAVCATSLASFSVVGTRPGFVSDAEVKYGRIVTVFALLFIRSNRVLIALEDVADGKHSNSDLLRA